MKREQTFFWFLLLASALLTVHAKKPKEKPDWAKKDIKFYSDADMERLLDQWEVGTDRSLQGTTGRF